MKNLLIHFTIFVGILGVTWGLEQAVPQLSDRSIAVFLVLIGCQLAWGIGHSEQQRLADLKEEREFIAEAVRLAREKRANLGMDPDTGRPLWMSEEIFDKCKKAGINIYEICEELEDERKRIDRPWWGDVLGIELVSLSDSCKELAEKRYRELANIHHPDRGGSMQKMAELNQAIKEAREFFKS